VVDVAQPDKLASKAGFRDKASTILFRQRAIENDREQTPKGQQFCGSRVRLVFEVFLNVNAC
jgi:hypothetical protein